MKTIALTLFTIFSIWVSESDGLIVTDEKVSCIISQTTTLEQLKQYKAELLEKKNIQLDIEHVDINRDGLITNLKISVDCHDGFKGSAQLLFKDQKTKMNFYRIYTKGIDSPFGIGAL